MNQPDRICLDCGMRSIGTSTCPKCDANLDQQTDGSVRSIDIAHQGETQRQALGKLQAEIEDISTNPAQFLRLIVGSGVIREAALAELAFYHRRQQIVSFEPDRNNPGAIMVRLK